MKEYVINEIKLYIKNNINDYFDDEETNLISNISTDDIKLMSEKILDNLDEIMKDEIYEQLMTYLEEIREKGE